MIKGLLLDNDYILYQVPCLLPATNPEKCCTAWNIRIPTLTQSYINDLPEFPEEFAVHHGKWDLD